MDENSLHNEASQAAQEETQSEDLRERIKQITLKALTERQLDKDNIKTVVETVVGGVSEGIGDSGERLKPAFKATLSGIDDALAKSAVAAKLAAEEVMSKTEKFANQDIKSLIDDMKGVEDILFDSINRVAKNGNDFVSSTLSEMSDHLKNTGTQVGNETMDAVKSLTDALESAGKQGFDEMTNASKDLANNVAQVASGILAGMAEAIKPKDKS